jgi:hypothetical protein
MTMIVGELYFFSVDGAAAGVKALNEAGYDVEVSDSIFDPENEFARFAEARKHTNLTGDELREYEHAVWDEINTLAGRLDEPNGGGDCQACGAVDDSYTPFKNFR